MAGYALSIPIAVLSVAAGSTLLLFTLLGSESRFRRFYGFASFSWVLVPSSAYSLAEAAAIAIGSPCRVPLGLGWIMYNAGQYRLNGIGGFFPRSVKYFAAATIVDVVVQGLGIASAVFSLVAHPFASVAELFRHSYPFFEEGVSVLTQAHPAYLLAVCGIIAGFALLGRGAAAPAEPPLPMGDRSLREREVADLLSGGASYKEIAHSLHISLATVKSHASSAYVKLGVRSRFELAARMGREGGA